METMNPNSPDGYDVYNPDDRPPPHIADDMAKSVEKIPADEIVTMSPLLFRAFQAGDCNPICHCCFKELLIGSPFKLATVKTYDINRHMEAVAQAGITESREVMLCDKCTVSKLKRQTAKLKREYETRRVAGAGCYRVNGKIVH